MRSRVGIALLAGVLVALLIAAGAFVSPEPEEPPATPFSFRGQTLQARPLLLGNVETVAAASTVEVPEVRGRNGSRSISIGYTVVPGADGAGDIPLVMLAGGPGGSLTSGTSIAAGSKSASRSSGAWVT